MHLEHFVTRQLQISVILHPTAIDVFACFFKWYLCFFPFRALNNLFSALLKITHSPQSQGIRTTAFRFNTMGEMAGNFILRVHPPSGYRIVFSKKL